MPGIETCTGGHDIEASGKDRGSARVKRLVESQRVMLLMKGTPDSPKCGFSSRVVSILQELKAPFGHFDILSDQEIRQAGKVIQPCKPLNGTSTHELSSNCHKTGLLGLS